MGGHETACSRTTVDCVEFELNDLLYTVCAKNTRNANVVTVNTELTVKESTGRQNTLLVLED